MITLHMESLFEHLNAGELEDALAELPDSIDKTYHSAMSRIMEYPPRKKELALSTLMWVAFGQRRLYATELQHAVATKPGRLDISRYTTPMSTLTALCAGLVVVQQKTVIRGSWAKTILEQEPVDLVRELFAILASLKLGYLILWITDFTTQEFFDRFRDIYFPEADQQMTLTTLAYLSRPGQVDLDDFDYGETTGYKWVDWKQKHPFYDYSALNWGSHAQKCHDAVYQTVLSFLSQGSDILFPCVNHLCEVIDICGVLGVWEIIENHPQYAGIFLAIHHGQSQALDFFLSKYSDIICELDKPNPFICWASGLNQVEALEVLLGFCWATPTQTLCLQRDTIIAGLNGKFGWEEDTPLSWACFEGHESIVKLLLNQPGVLADLEGRWKMTPLDYASRGGHTSIVKLLLARPDVDPNHRDSADWTPLARAAVRGHNTVVELLLSCPTIDAEARTVYDQTPLFLASGRGHDSALKILLSRPDVDINSRDGKGHTPLWWARDQKKHSVVQLLLAHGAQE
jgi:hypothetical protein